MHQHRRDIDSALAAATERIVREVGPLAVVLFGSRARGEAKPHSDVDLLIVVRESTDQKAAWRSAWEALKGLGVDKDVLIATPEKIRRFGTMIGLVYRPALQEGRVLYEAGEWDTRCEVSEAEVEAQVRGWMARAQRDLRGARHFLEDDDPGNAAYHAHQAAEKAIKAVLIFLQTEYPNTHKLEELMPRVPSGFELRTVVWHPDLNAWALGGRYPDAGIEPGDEEARIAISNATAMLEAARRDLTARGLAVNSA